MSDDVATVLLIDDDQGLLVGLTAIMRRAGYRTLTAVDGAQGLNLAKENLPDLIICDVMMSSPNGFEVRKTLSRDPQTEAIPFIFLTARIGELDMVHAFEAGADDYIKKPFSQEEIIARSESILRRHRKGIAIGRAEMEVEMVSLRQDLSSSINHEFRKPLDAITNTLETLLNDPQQIGTDDQQETLQIALDNAEWLRSLIEDLITLADSDLDQLDVYREQIDIESDFQEIVTNCLQRWEEKKLDVNIYIDPEVDIHAPRQSFQRAIAHLVDNACKFSPIGGELDIKLHARGEGGCTFIVRDDGSGIPIEFRDQVFERYFQIAPKEEEKNGGVGVGLTIARIIARSLGGDITILDSLQGCRVQMIIPPHPLDVMSNIYE